MAPVAALNISDDQRFALMKVRGNLKLTIHKSEGEKKLQDSLINQAKKFS